MIEQSTEEPTKLYIEIPVYNIFLFFLFLGKKFNTFNLPLKNVYGGLVQSRKQQGGGERIR